MYNNVLDVMLRFIMIFINFVMIYTWIFKQILRITLRIINFLYKSNNGFCVEPHTLILNNSLQTRS